MATGIVKGESVINYYWNGSAFVPFACARSITINLKQNLIPKSTVGSGDFQEFDVSYLSWDFSQEGIMYLNKPSFVDTGNIIDTWLSKAKILMQFLITDSVGNTLQYRGFALIPQVSLTGSVNNVASTNITGQGT